MELPVRFIIHYLGQQHSFYFQRSATFSDVAQRVSTQLKQALKQPPNSRLSYAFVTQDGKLISWTSLQKKKLSEEYSSAVQTVELWVSLPNFPKPNAPMISTETGSQNPPITQTTTATANAAPQPKKFSHEASTETKPQQPKASIILVSTPAPRQTQSPSVVPKATKLDSEKTPPKTPSPPSTSQTTAANAEKDRVSPSSTSPQNSSSSQIPPATNVQPSSEETSAAPVKSECTSASSKQNDDRIKQALQRQREREMKMREKEQKKREEELKQKQLREANLQAQMAALKAKEEARKKQDRLVRGFVGHTVQSYLHNTSASLKSPEEVALEESMEKERQQLGLATGEQWVKTDFGWQRGAPTHSRYKSPATATFLPTWLFDELDFNFGLRRSSSSDFQDSCRILERLCEQFYETTGWFQPQMIAYLQLVEKQLGRTVFAFVDFDKVCDMVLKLFETATNTLQKTHTNKVRLKSQHIQESREEQGIKLIQRFVQSVQAKRVELLEQQRQQLAQMSFDYDSYIPNEIWIEIFMYLDKPRDLCAVSQVCYRWNCLANEQVLFQSLLKRHFPDAYGAVQLLNADLPRVAIFNIDWKQHYIRAFKQSQSTDWDVAGLFQCSQCNQFYWGAQNTSVSCHISLTKVKKHQRNTPKINPNEIVSHLLKRPVPMASDVMFF